MSIRNKPDGGFRFIGAYELLGIYFGYSAGRIRWYDVRAWFACQEAVARRCCTQDGTSARYRVEEIGVLVGAPRNKQVRAALRRLQAAGLLDWSAKSVRFPSVPAPTESGSFAAFQGMLRRLGQSNRKIPVPRRTLRFLASGPRKVATATMLGHLLRCCYYRKSEYLFEGSCSAAWVAKLFELDERNVKIARKGLVSRGWLTPMRADAWHRQRFGGRWAVNPEWTPPGRQQQPNTPKLKIKPRPRPERSPRISRLGDQRSPLLILKENSFGSKNQKPALAAVRPTGVCKRNSVSTKPPTLKHIVMEDLRDTARTVRLFEEAVKEGLVCRCEADRLKVVAAAERALRVADRNPCGFFAKLMRERLWHHVDHEEEDRARQKLVRHFVGQTPPPVATLLRDAYAPSELSMDAKVVAAVKRTLARHRVDVDAFEALRRERPDWTQSRWRRAESELASTRCARIEGKVQHVA